MAEEKIDSVHILSNLPSLRNEDASFTISNMPSNIHHYVQEATSENTRRAYQNDIRHFIYWGGTLPTTPETVMHYLHHYADQLNSRTLMRRLTALKHWHTYQGFSDPTAHPYVRKALTGIQRVHGRPKEKALALSMDALLTMVRWLQLKPTSANLRNNALLQIGFFGSLRRSELVNILFEHIHWVKEGVEILIPRSKTDTKGEGHICAIPYGDGQLCPSTALRQWLEKASIQSGPVFRRITKEDIVLPQALQANYISQLIKAVAHRSGLAHAEQYSGHSLRRGFATTAGQQGVHLSAIMQQGRWKHANTALGYIEEGKRFEDNAAGLVLKKVKEI